MPNLGISLAVGRSATSSGRPGGGATPFANELSISLDGADDYVINSSLASGLTIEGISLWFKPDVAYQHGGTKTWILGFGGSDEGIALAGDWFGPVTDELITVANNNHLWSYTSTGALSTSTWYHLAVRWESSSSSTNSGNAGYDIFLNGTKVGNAFGTYTSGDGSQISADAIVVGARYRSSLAQMFYNGFVDEVAIFNSAISEADITAIYNSGTPASLEDYTPATWWRMGDGTEAGAGTTIYDMSSNSNNGTLTNGPTFSSDVPVPPPFSTASVDFDGTDDTAQGDVGSNTNVETFSIWFKSPNSFASDGASGAAEVLFGWGANSSRWGLAIGGGMITAMPSSLIYVRHTNNGAYGYTPGSVTTLAADTWHHIATRWSTSSETNSGSNGYDIWLNGTKITGSEATSNGTMSTTPEQVVTGYLSGIRFARRTNNSSTYTYEGLIDEVAIWSSALSEADVTALYNSGVPGDLTDLSPTFWYRFGENDGSTGTTITDQGSGEADLTLANGPTFSTDTP